MTERCYVFHFSAQQDLDGLTCEQTSYNHTILAPSKAAAFIDALVLARTRMPASEGWGNHVVSLAIIIQQNPETGQGEIAEHRNFGRRPIMSGLTPMGARLN